MRNDKLTEWYIGQFKQMIDSYIEELEFNYDGRPEDFNQYMMGKVKERFPIIKEIREVI